MVKDEENIKLGIRIKNARESANMTQFALYEKTGISTAQISAFENGRRSIGLQSLSKISNALGKTMDEIYNGGYEDRPISSATNKGELIVNCVDALFEEGVISYLYKEKVNDFVDVGYEQYYKIGFRGYVDILDDLVSELYDFNSKKDSYPDPNSFKKQLLASAANRINNSNK